MGGQILVRIVRKTLGEQVAGKTEFLASYGDGVRPMWQSLCSVLRGELREPRDQEAAIAAARETFKSFGNWFGRRYS